MPPKVQRSAKRLRGSEERRGESDDLFAENDRPALALLALLARESVRADLPGNIMSDLLMDTSANSNPADAPPALSAAGLVAAYPEVRALRCILTVRTSLRALQGCEDAERPVLFASVASALDSIYHDVVPDPLFAALAKVIRGWLGADAASQATAQDLPAAEKTNLLERQILNVVEELQLELLRQSKQLTRRATALTLRYRHQIPFCS